MRVRGFVNIYRTGWFHREGKPGTYNRHPADIYDQYEDAIKNIDPPSHYISTVPIEFEDDTGDVVLHGPDSQPVGLAITRKRDLQKVLANPDGPLYNTSNELK